MNLEAIKQRFGIVGNSPLLNRAINIASQVASTDLSVLILGESGSGKEFFPKIIHELSARKHKNYVAINCGAIPEGTIDSELFGHEKGAFTDAREERKGYFEEASGGTIFLDEVAELPLGTQVRLLRVLESGEFLKVGSSKAQKTNVRVVAATNVNVLEAISKGRFREDLYYRLNAITINVPPLRDRKEDIEILFRKFSSELSEKYRIPPLELSAEAKELLLSYNWKGNVRELKNVAEQLTIIETNRLLSVESLRNSLHIETQASNLPTLWRGEDSQLANSSAMSEREILYSILFEMQKDIRDLKRFMAEELSLRGEAGLRSGAGFGARSANFGATSGAGAGVSALDAEFAHSDASVLHSAAHSFRGEASLSSSKFIHQDDNTLHPIQPVSEAKVLRGDGITNPMLRSDGMAQPVAHSAVQPMVHPVTHSSVHSESEISEVFEEIEDDDSLSLGKNEKNIIIQALKKHGGNRRKAAEDLGISQRTIYRKLKDFGLQILILPLLCLGFNSCGIYSFTGASIPPGTKTIAISYFKNRAPSVQPTLSSVFSDKIQDYFVSQSNLSLVDAGADIVISGDIVNYNVSPMAIQGNDIAAKNRLTITIRVKFVNKLDPKSDFEQNFSRYEDWDSNINLSEVEEGLIESICTQIIEDIYQRAFVNW